MPTKKKPRRVRSFKDKEETRKALAVVGFLAAVTVILSIVAGYLAKDGVYVHFPPN